MLESIKRIFGKQGTERDLTDLSVWAQRHGHGFKRARGDAGFVIDGLLDGKAWRMEWGPPQRGYIAGHELRLRMELDLASHAQMLLLSTPLMDTLERQTFEEFTDNVQTQIGTKTPEEMRWLVMFPKVNLGTLTALNGRFGAVASDPAAGLAWIDGPLANALEQATAGFLREQPPFVVMTLRGRVYLRVQLDVPDAAVMNAALALFETAVAEALRATAGAGDASHAWGQTASTAWQSLQPSDTESRKSRR